VLVGTIWGFFLHANVRWRLGPVEQLFASPRFHHWHHVRAGPIDRNYASMLPLMDRLFGTLHLPGKSWPEAYGISEPQTATESKEPA
jgi:sterol desaturase/sphingolipid hydroxylase (fatty acid hydroxylase superfamily)